MHYQCEKNMKDLLRQQLTLQNEIKVKENTIYIGKSHSYALKYHPDENLTANPLNLWPIQYLSHKIPMFCACKMPPLYMAAQTN